MTQPRFTGLERGARADAPSTSIKDKTSKGPNDDDMEDETEGEAEENAEANEGDEADPKDTKKESKGKKAKEQEGQASNSPTDLVATERQRVADVFDSDAVNASNYSVAAEMLATTDMSAGSIVKVLPKCSAGSATGDLGQQMLSQAREGGQADLGDDSSDDVSASGGNPLIAIAENLKA